MLDRRQFATGVAALFASCTLSHAQQSAPKMTAAEAHKKASAGEILLIDVRSPDEWKASGVGVGAQPISMHQPGFLKKLAAAKAANAGRSIALMCATGSRSGWLQNKLREFGYTGLISVSEGMFGSADGPGWIKAGLPIKKYGQ